MESVDVLVIGAGINGAATFRDLAFQGVDVLLVDRGDICSGTSAAPSRMIHGGLRYLEHGEFRLVKEALRERDLLLHNARHFVRPLPTFIPVRSWTSGIGSVIGTFLGMDVAPAQRGGLMVRSGLQFYDLYTRRRRTMPSHEFVDRDDALEKWPGLSEDIVGVARYHDAWISHPERLCLEIVLDGIESGGAVRPYTAVDGLEDGAVRLRAEDGGTSVVRAKVVVNAAGPWIDAVNADLGIDDRLIGGTKGSHLVLDHPELAAMLDDEMLYHETPDGRTGLMFPWHGRVIAGATDIRVDDPDGVVTDDEEVQYILDTVNAIVPGMAVGREHIVSTFVGVRPLPYQEGVAPSKVSRDHSMPEHEPTEGRPFPVLSLVGGKWTTFRAFAEEATDAALERLGRERVVITEPSEIGGARGYPSDPVPWMAELAEATGLGAERVAVLTRRYGSKAKEVAAAVAGDDEPLPHLTWYSAAELDWIARHEHVTHLSDVLERRTNIAVLGDAGPDIVRDAAVAIAGAMDWDEQRVETEIERALRSIERRHGIPVA